MKVDFTHKNGRVQPMAKHYADILTKLGKGSYQTKVMRPADKAFPGTSDKRTIAEVDAQIKAENAAPVGDGLDGLDRDALAALAEERGFKVHHKSGADKIRAALRGE